MASLNRIVILGRLLNNPETRFSVEGLLMAKFILPVSSGFNEMLGKIEVVCFGKLAELCGQYFKIDTNVLVEGRLQVRSFEDQSGARKWVTEVVANNIELVDSVKPSSAPQAAVPVAASENSEEEEVPDLPDDDLPF